SPYTVYLPILLNTFQKVQEFAYGFDRSVSVDCPGCLHSCRTRRDHAVRQRRWRWAMATETALSPGAADDGTIAVAIGHRDNAAGLHDVSLPAAFYRP